MLLFHLGSVDDGDAFLAERWPGARAVADPGAVFYEGVELGRMRLREMLRPTVWARGLQAVSKGHGVGRPVGDPLRMPGFFLVEADGRIRWSHRSRHTADHPDLARLPALASRA